MHNNFERLKGLDPAFPLYMFSSPSARLSANDAKFVDVIHTDGGVLGFPWPLGHADFFPNGGIPLQPGCAKQELSKNRWFGVIGMFTHFFSSRFSFLTIIDVVKWLSNLNDISIPSPNIAHRDSIDSVPKYIFCTTLYRYRAHIVEISKHKICSVSNHIFVFGFFFLRHAIVGCSHQRAWEYFIESIEGSRAFLATHCELSTQQRFKNISCDKNVKAYMGLHADKRYLIKFSQICKTERHTVNSHKQRAQCSQIKPSHVWYGRAYGVRAYGHI